MALGGASVRVRLIRVSFGEKRSGVNDVVEKRSGDEVLWGEALFW